MNTFFEEVNKPLKKCSEEDIYCNEKDAQISKLLANYESLFDFCGVPMLILNPNFEIIKINSALLKLTNKKKDDLMVGSLYNQIPNLENIIDKKKLKLLKDEIRLFDHLDTFVLAKILPCHTKKNRLEQIIISLEDITKRRNLEKQKEQFFSLISHEINTPISVITGFSEILEDLTLENNAVDLNFIDLNSILNPIVTASKKLSEILRQIIEASKGMASKIEISLEELDILEVLNTSLTRFNPIFKAKNIDFNFSTIETIKIYGNKSLLVSIFTQIIDNAIKFSKGKSTFEISIAQNKKECFITFEDNGIGIQKNDLEDISKPFFQSEDYMTRYYQGIGLGLTIAKRGTEIHGGTFTIESEVNKGTKITIKLPLFETEESNNLFKDSEFIKLKMQNIKYAHDFSELYKINKAKNSEISRLNKQLINYAKDLKKLILEVNKNK